MAYLSRSIGLIRQMQGQFVPEGFFNDIRSPPEHLMPCFHVVHKPLDMHFRYFHAYHKPLPAKRKTRELTSHASMSTADRIGA